MGTQTWDYSTLRDLDKQTDRLKTPVTKLDIEGKDYLNSSQWLKSQTNQKMNNNPISPLKVWRLYDLAIDIQSCSKMTSYFVPLKITKYHVIDLYSKWKKSNYIWKYWLSFPQRLSTVFLKFLYFVSIKTTINNVSETCQSRMYR